MVSYYNRSKFYVWIARILYSSFVVLIAKLADLDTGGYSYLFPLGSIETYKFKDIIFRGDLRHISQHVVEKGGEDNGEKKTS